MAVRGVAERSGGVDHVVDENDFFVLHVADDVHDLADVRLLAALVHNGERAADALGKVARARDGAEVGGNNHIFVVVAGDARLDVGGEQRDAEQMVDRDVEEALNLRRVQVHGQHAVRARRGDAGPRRASP